MPSKSTIVRAVGQVSVQDQGSGSSLAVRTKVKTQYMPNKHKLYEPSMRSEWPAV